MDIWRNTQTMLTTVCALVTVGAIAQAHPIVQRASVAAMESEQGQTEEKILSVFGRSVNLAQYRTIESTFTLTAYNLDRASTGKSPGEPGFGVTSTGTHAESGRTVAVDPSVIPYGSLLYIEGLGWRVAEDTGGAIHGHHIDVLMNTRGNALKFGVKRHCKVEVYLPLNISPVTYHQGRPLQDS